MIIEQPPIESIINEFGIIAKILVLGLAVVMTLGLALGVFMSLVSIQDQELHISLKKTAIENVDFLVKFFII